MIEPILHPPDGVHRGVLEWRCAANTTMISSAPVRGGWTTARWLINIGVELNYGRTDLDVHSDEIATHLGLEGTGVAMLTAADVTAFRRGESGGVVSHATVGITKPTWAASDDDGWSAWHPGTINIVAQMPVAFSPAAAVNAVMTMTEAKTQALVDAGVPGTGTASDSVAIMWPSDAEPVVFGGPRSPWGARLARSVYGAVADGIEAWS